jgi:hypothetical protein
MDGQRGSGKVVVVLLAAAALFSGGVLVAVHAVAGASSLRVLTDTTTPEPAPPPATTSVPTPEPEPAPAPKPVSKPQPKPSPKSPPKRSPVTHSSSRANTNPSLPRAVRATRSAPSSKRTAVRRRPVVHRRTAKARPHKAPHAAKKRTERRKRPGQVLAAHTGAAAPAAVVTGDKPNRARPLIFALLCLSFLLLGIGAMPVRFVPWRRVADVLEQQHGELTVSGIACFAIALVTMLIAKGS